MINVKESINLTDLRYLASKDRIRHIISSIDILHIKSLLNTSNIITISDMLNISNKIEEVTFLLLEVIDLLKIIDIIDKNQLVEVLCNMLRNQTNVQHSSLVMIALYRIISSHTSISEPIKQNIQDSLQSFRHQERQKETFVQEHYQLIDAIEKYIHSPSPISYVNNQTPDERSASLRALQQQQLITTSQVEDILHSCSDKRNISKGERQKIGHRSKYYFLSDLTVQHVAWDLLEQPFTITKEVIDVIHHALGNHEGLTCAAAALFLKNNRKRLSDRDRKDFSQVIANLLQHNVSSRVFIDTSDFWIKRLDDVLFETLRELTE